MNFFTIPAGESQGKYQICHDSKLKAAHFHNFKIKCFFFNQLTWGLHDCLANCSRRHVS